MRIEIFLAVKYIGAARPGDKIPPPSSSRKLISSTFFLSLFFRPYQAFSRLLQKIIGVKKVRFSNGRWTKNRCAKISAGAPKEYERHKKVSVKH